MHREYIKTSELLAKIIVEKNHHVNYVEQLVDIYNKQIMPICTEHLTSDLTRKFDIEAYRKIVDSGCNMLWISTYEERVVAKKCLYRLIESGLGRTIQIEKPWHLSWTMKIFYEIEDTFKDRLRELLEDFIDEIDKIIPLKDDVAQSKRIDEQEGEYE